VSEDPKWELAILASVQSFHEKLLQPYLDGEVPVPQGLEAISLQQDDGDVHGTLIRMRRWLRLLDRAITPAMLRHAFTPETDPEIAEAMLRYLVRNKDLSPANRDKTDLVATFLYRHPRVPGQWERRGYGLDGSLPLSPFEIALLEILADTDMSSLPEQHLQLLRAFDELREEATGFKNFHALLESNIIGRVREMKQAFEESFYHPSVLATIAPYNATFGKKFDELFHHAAEDIKNFASELEQQGGTILGNVDGMDVTVEHVAVMQEAALLQLDYGTALDKFRRVSKLKRALETRPPIRRAAPARAAKSASGAAAAAAPAPVRRQAIDVAAARAAVTPQQTAMEETKLRKVEESIRVFVRVADPKFRRVVPMRFFNLTLTNAEADAYCAEYLEEKTLRAGVGRILLRSVAVLARMMTELEDLKNHENSGSLWKLHADSLVVLLQIAATLKEHAERVRALAEQHNEPPQVEAIQASMEKLGDRVDLAARILGSAN
jgi:hypothetical protein